MTMQLQQDRNIPWPVAMVDLASAAARCLVHLDGIERLAGAAEVLGNALTRHGLALPERVLAVGFAPGQSRTAARRVLH
jgi:hypothetical protein